MTLTDYLTALRRGWIVILAVVVIALGCAALVVLRAPQTYTATTQLYVSSERELAEPGSPVVVEDDLAGGRIRSFATALGGNVALERVREAVGGSGDESVSVQAILDTVVLEISVTSSDAERSAAVARGYAEVGPELLESLEQGPDGEPAVTVSTIAEATVPGPSVTPAAPTLLAAGVLGLGLGMSIVLVRETLRRERREREGAAEGSA